MTNTLGSVVLIVFAVFVQLGEEFLAEAEIRKSVLHPRKVQEKPREMRRTRAHTRGNITARASANSPDCAPRTAGG